MILKASQNYVVFENFKSDFVYSGGINPYHSNLNNLYSINLNFIKKLVSCVVLLLI